MSSHPRSCQYLKLPIFVIMLKGNVRLWDCLLVLVIKCWSFCQTLWLYASPAGCPHAETWSFSFTVLFFLPDQYTRNSLQRVPIGHVTILWQIKSSSCHHQEPLVEEERTGAISSIQLCARPDSIDLYWNINPSHISYTLPSYWFFEHYTIVFFLENLRVFRCSVYIIPVHGSYKNKLIINNCIRSCKIKFM